MEKLAVLLAESTEEDGPKGNGWSGKSIEIHLMKKLDKVAWEGEKSENVESNLLFGENGKKSTPTHAAHTRVCTPTADLM